jgi:phosphatidylglycerol:prolipoprotein diacylglycerol transferase
VIIPAPNDVAFNLFSMPVYWYGIILAFSIFVGIICANSLFNKINPADKRDLIVECCSLIIILGILCARIYYCGLNFHYYFSHPAEILYIREGGLSIHGAIIGGILSVIIMSKRYKIPFFSILDPIACAAILGQSIGRWGNYFNSEAYGYPTVSQNWGLFIPQAKRISEYADMQYFHPAFLYESVLDLLALFILLFLLNKFGKKIRGLVFFSYITIYAVIRFFIEKIRIDSALNIGSIPFPEVISIILLVIGTIGIILSVTFAGKKNGKI